jgi:glycosyltransferase involved in cell wall biosynthesis
MIYFDVTKTGWARHRSGLTRVSSRLAEELGAAASPVRWDRGAFRPAHGGGTLDVRPTDWLLTAELFSEEERPGLGEFVRARPCRLAAIFHDNIPLRLPHVTWPQSVERHPGYVKLLAGFDRIWAVSADSRDDLLGFWQWQGAAPAPRVDLLALGADFNRQPRTVTGAGEGAERRGLVSVGIIEPRKNQAFLLETCTGLWDEGLEFTLHIVGRVNPHFGKKIVKQIVALQKRYPALQFHEAADDELLRRIYAQARASVFPTLAEGCGLPLLESLWLGVPCVCSDLPVLRENAAGGGCLPAAVNDRAAWRAALRAVLTDDAVHARLVQAATTRPLPTWAQAAEVIQRELG